MLGEGMDEGRRQIISLFARTDEDLWKGYSWTSSFVIYNPTKSREIEYNYFPSVCQIR
jgi:hypothetical protein